MWRSDSTCRAFKARETHGFFHFLYLYPRVNDHVSCFNGPPSAFPRPFYCIYSVLRKAKRRSGRRVASRSFFRCPEENGKCDPKCMAFAWYLFDAFYLGPWILKRFCWFKTIAWVFVELLNIEIVGFVTRGGACVACSSCFILIFTILFRSSSRWGEVGWGVPLLQFAPVPAMLLRNMRFRFTFARTCC